MLFSNFNVTFHPSLADANANTNSINNNEYTNLSNPQTIYVRVEDGQSGCFNSNLSFEIDFCHRLYEVVNNYEISL